MDVLIHGAFGCGAFRNDPAAVAEAYKTVLEAFHNFSLIEFANICGSRETEKREMFSEVLR